MLLRLALLVPIVLAGTLDAGTFTGLHLRRHRSATDRRLVEQVIDLTLDDISQRLTLDRPNLPVAQRVVFPYSQVTKVIFETTQHQRVLNKKSSVAMIALAAAAPLASIAADRIVVDATVKDFLCYIERDNGTPLVIEIPAALSVPVQSRIRALFSSKLEPSPYVRSAAIDRNSLPELHLKHSLKAVKNSPAFRPQPMPGKALVVAVVPALHFRTTGKGFQHKLYANGKLVTINTEGTYSAFQLDPGEYALVSQTSNASGLTVTLKAGEEYYFLQNNLAPSRGTLSGRNETSLTRHSKEYVLFEVSGAYLSDWHLKRH
jgi:hypothetical protein